MFRKGHDMAGAKLIVIYPRPKDVEAFMVFLRRRREIRSRSEMRRATTVLCLFSILTFGIAQKNGSSQPVTPSVGLPVGAKAPAFASRDQFDRAQSNATLRGPNGTILLFFRSADW